MTISLYQASVPVFVRTMKNLSVIIEKAAAHADARKIDPAVLLASRLYPDMLPLSRQIQIVSDVSKGCASRLAGIDPPSYEDNETTFPQLSARLLKTIDYLGTLKPGQIDGSEEREISIKYRDKVTTYVGLPYLLHNALPNFFFHVTTAYAILRHNGMELGKRDYLA